MYNLKLISFNMQESLQPIPSRDELRARLQDIDASQIDDFVDALRLYGLPVVKQRVASLLREERTDKILLWLAGGEVVLPQLVAIPAGAFYFRERSAVNLVLPTFFMSQTPITNSQYQGFLEATGHRQPQYWNDRYLGISALDGDGQPIGEHLPVVGVSFDDALAFCKWARVRLPTEFEWEKAARGINAQQFPWGNTFQAEERGVVFASTRTQPVNRPGVERGQSPYAVYDMSGQVSEWVHSWSCATSEFNFSDSHNPRGPAYEGRERVLRGGSFESTASSFLECVFRDGSEPDLRHNDVGFRVVRDVLL
ncbi:MAG: SUMF1/EgtB/PvdO family nonheme iron enzyme [Candidatus Saganbacteria bacterium]|nr:SUMF1/EgtB/PvdO family nonheme iron enzyme [Candidatus Saganbacteria bacterium]